MTLDLTEAQRDIVSRVRLLRSRLLVRPLEEPAKTRGGIHIPETAKALHSINKVGQVVAVGQGHPITKGKRSGHWAPPTVEVGEMVVYLRWMEETGSNPALSLEDLYIIEEKDILFAFPADEPVTIANPTDG